MENFLINIILKIMNYLKKVRINCLLQLNLCPRCSRKREKIGFMPCVDKWASICPKCGLEKYETMEKYNIKPLRV